MARKARSAETLNRAAAAPAGSPPPARPLSSADTIRWLETLDLGALRVQFRNHTGRIAPARIGRPLLLRVLAYRVQADQQGDLKPDTRRLLARLAANARMVANTGAGGEEKTAAALAAPVPLRPAPLTGTVLVREWQGRLERVRVGQGGYDWNGSSYPSLSAAAQAITGTKWNGRRFFGLDRPAAKTGAAA